jgi:radical SAM superfamily enzyme YgiQ (UPF0313 family)
MTYDEIESAMRAAGGMDEIYVGCTFTYNNESAHRVVALCKKIFPAAKVILGGIYPTLCPEEARKSQADEVFHGEYPGITDCKINYHVLGYVPDYILVKGTHGCPYNCAYCAVHILEGREFSFRSPDDVIQEIGFLHAKYGIREVGIWDSNLLVCYDRYFKKVLEGVTRERWPLSIYAPEGLDYRFVTQDIADALARGGFRDVNLSIENFDEMFAKNSLNRVNTIQRLKESVSCLRKAGFRDPQQINIAMMTALPGQSVNNVVANIKFIWSLGCSVIIYPFSPIPGTALYAQSSDLVKGKRLPDLHPLFHSCSTSRKERDFLLEIFRLNYLPGNSKLKRDLPRSSESGNNGKALRGREAKTIARLAAVQGNLQSVA